MKRAMPKPIEETPSVMMKGETPKIATPMPLTIPTSRPAPRTQPISKKPACRDPNTPTPAAPRKNAGPHWLQKSASRRPSSGAQSPRAASSAAVRAPTG